MQDRPLNILRMTTTSGRRAEPTLGRKQDVGRTDAILEAAAETLFEVGYENLRIRDVASRAGCGTGAIYRRWETKEALIAEAIRTGPDPSPTIPLTHSPQIDLAAAIAIKVRTAAEHPDLMPGLISAMRSNQEIKAAIQARYTTEPMRLILERLLGPSHPHLDLLAELVPAITLHRTTLTGSEINQDKLTKDLIGLIEAIIQHPPTEADQRQQPRP